MHDYPSPAQAFDAPEKPPVLAIVEHQVLVRTCIVKILRREFADFEIVEMATIGGLDGLSGRDVHLVALDIGDKPITDPSVADGLTSVVGSHPNAYVALLSSRDDDETASAAMQRGVRGFFPTSIPIEVAIAGLHLVLAGGVYRPLPIVGSGEASNHKTAPASSSAPALPRAGNGNGGSKTAPERAMVDRTPREQHVLAVLKLGLPNKLIAARLNLSENTVKMHIQHIMRKCAAHNRTEAALRWSERLTPEALLH
jgi:DNA-binding NarL/FixJ family response regulator